MTERFEFYQIKRIFVACPGDLTSERSQIPSIVDELNELYVHQKGFHLLLVGWEETIPNTGRPQALINQQLRQADLVVIMLHLRIGSSSRLTTDLDVMNDEDVPLIKYLPDGWVSDHGLPITGTIEEFCVARHLFETSRRPSIGVYFKKVDTKAEQQDLQQKGVQVFRKYLEDGKQFLYR